MFLYMFISDTYNNIQIALLINLYNDNQIIISGITSYLEPLFTSIISHINGI